jgi:type III secretion system OrgA/MxiK family protein
MHDPLHERLPLATPTRWQTVMFDPLAYIHPERLRMPAGFDAPAQRSTINRLLLDRYRLEAPPVGQQTHAEKFLLKHWLDLPQIILLLGCQRLRLALTRRGASLRLPASVQAFMTLPLLSPLPLPQAANPDRADILRQGMQQLRISLGQLPAALAQRLPLLFAPAFDRVPERESDAAEDLEACDPAHALTLTMAVQHVKRYPIGA